MDAKELKEITTELTLLYVEDDKNLREETAKLFSHLFKSTTSVENGKIALEKLEVNDFDLIITDINMPIMDGVVLSKSIKKLYPSKPIIITSAYDESSYLLDLIDIGIDKFILKPLDMQKFLHVLSEVCSHIRNNKLLQKYREEIEVSNKELTYKNEELESLVKILDTKIIQLNDKNKLIQKIPQKSPKDAINTISSNPPQVKRTLVEKSEDLYLYNEYMLNDELEQLKKLEKDIEAIATLFNLQDVISEEAVLHLAKNFSLYAKILTNYAVFKKLGTEINSLSLSIQKHPTSFIENAYNIYTLLESFIYVLKKWRLSLFKKGIKDPNIYDISMINDIKAVRLLLQNNEIDTSTELELF